MPKSTLREVLSKPAKSSACPTPQRHVLESMWQVAFGRPLSPKMRRPFGRVATWLRDLRTAWLLPSSRPGTRWGYDA